MTDNKEVKKKIIVISIMMIFFGALIEVLFMVFGNTTEKFTDVVIENLTILGGNKTFERNMVYCLIFAGMAVYGLYYLINKKVRASSLEENNSLDNTKENEVAKSLFLTGIISIFFVNTVIFNEFSIVLAVPLLLVLISYILKKSFSVQSFIVFFVSLYAFSAVYRVINAVILYGFNNYVKADNVIYLLLVSVSAIIAFGSIFVKKQELIIKYLLVCQLVIPFNIAILLNNEYLYNNQLVKVSNPWQTVIMVWLVIICLVVSAIKLIAKKWKESSCDINDILSMGTFISILFVNRFNGTGAIISTDVHHPYENIIGYFQIFEKTQKLFSDYIPISGLYSVIHGAIFKLLGNGEASFYFISDNFYYLIAIVFIVLLLKNRISNINILFVALTFFVIDYDRVVFILPIMLLLSHPALIKKKAYWFVAWFLTSLFHGLYYPLYGAAVAAAFLPLAIKLFVSYIKQKEYKTDVKSKGIVISVLVCVLLLVLSIPVLYGMYKHISILSSQTVMADGLTRFGQSIPDNFMPLCGSEGLRLFVYYLLSFLPLIVIAWLGFIAFIETKNCIYLAVSLVPAISYSSTLVRIDFFNLYARSEAPVFAACFLLIILLLNAKLDKKLVKYTCVLAVVIVALAGKVGVLSLSDKLDSVYVVPENYTYVANDKVEKLGTGFVENEMYSVVSDYYDKFSVSRDITFLGDPVFFGHFYLAESNGIGPMEIVNIPKGYEAAAETLATVKKNKSFVGSDFYPYDTYYIFKYLMTSGEYVWSDVYYDFVPNVYNLSLEEVQEINRNAYVSNEDYMLGRTPGTLGDSFETLEPVFSSCDIPFSVGPSENGLRVEFTESINGDDADFIYIDFDNANNTYEYGLFDNDGFHSKDNVGIFKNLYRKEPNLDAYVAVIWYDEYEEQHVMYASFVNGKLLFPIGAGKHWLLNEHSAIDICLLGDVPADFAPSLNDVKLLKLQELK